MNSRFFSLAILGLLLVAGCRSTDQTNSAATETITAQHYIRKNLGWGVDVDRNYCYNFGKNKNAKPLDASAKVFMAMALRRRAGNPDEAAAANKVLAAAQKELLAEVCQTPSELNTFVLAELLSFPAAPARDLPLAVQLYRYGAKKNYPPAMTRLGEMLLSNDILKRDEVTAQRLLRNAADAGVAEAEWQLYLFHSGKNHNLVARKPLRRSQGAAHPDALAEKVDDDDNSESARQTLLKLVRQGSGNAAVKLAGLLDINSHERLELLQIASLNGNKKAPLMLAQLYVNERKAVLDYTMAINSALLALENISTAESAAKLLLELDKDMPFVLVLAAMWQDTLVLGNDLAYAMLDCDALISYALRKQFTNCYVEINKMLAQSGNALYRNGVLLRLYEYSFPGRTLKMELDNHFQNNHDWLLTKLMISAQLNDLESQRTVSAELLAYIKRQQANTVNTNHRRELSRVIAEVNELEIPQSRLQSDAGKWCALWNIAVLLHVDALLKNGEKAQADKFLRRHPLHHLPQPFDKLQKNFVKRFADSLVKK